MPSTLSLSCSKKLYELLGQTYETEKYRDKQGRETTFGVGPSILSERCEDGSRICTSDLVKYTPAPSFSETIRLLPRIAEKNEWSENGLWGSADDIAQMYMLSDTEEEGMEQVSNYLEALL